MEHELKDEDNDRQYEDDCGIREDEEEDTFEEIHIFLKLV